MKLRSAEWLLTVYFAYVALISTAFPLPSRFPPFVVAMLVPALFLVLARGNRSSFGVAFSMARDWAAVALVLVAYREMDWFSALPRNFPLELHWVEWDRAILYHRGFAAGGLQREIESLGPVGPIYLELCYLLVYALAPFVVAILYFEGRRERVNGVLFLYLLGTLLAYALFPYFPSDPPRVAFGGSDMPNVSSVLRELNLRLVGDYGIHSSVFPSARIVRIFGGVDAARISAGAQANRLGNVGLRDERGGGDNLWPLPLRS